MLQGAWLLAFVGGSVGTRGWLGMGGRVGGGWGSWLVFKAVASLFALVIFCFSSLVML